MSLHLWYGRVGTPKNEAVVSEIRSLLARADAPSITVVVPDQYGLASEHFFLQALGAEAFSRITVSTLKSLARMQMHDPNPVLREGGRVLLMKQAIDTESPQFKYYPKGYSKLQFVTRLIGAFKELKAAGVTLDHLEEAEKQPEQNGFNPKKLHDLALIGRAYEGLIRDRFADPEDLPARYADAISEDDLFRDAVVFFCDFRTFYHKERMLIFRMLENNADVTVLLPCVSETDNEICAAYPSAQEARILLTKAKQNGVRVTTKLFEDVCEFENEEGKHLEHLFASDAFCLFPRPSEHVHLYSASDRYDECEAVAAEIARRIREDGVHYSDFLVISRSPDRYEGILDEVFHRYDIPVFFQRKTPLARRNPLNLIGLLFRLADEGLEQGTVLDFVKLWPFPQEKVDAFEQYVTVWNPQFSDFEKEFKRSLHGLGASVRPEEVASIRDAEEVRKKTVELIDEVKRFFTESSTVRSVCETLWNLLKREKITSLPNANVKAYEAYGKTELAARQAKVLNAFVSVLDELVDTVGASPCPTASEYLDLFNLVVSQHDIAIVPTSLDEVLVGSPENLPLTAPSYAFVLGMNNGEFPKPVDDNRLLTDGDRKLLEQYGLRDTTDDKIYLEYYYQYAAITAARREFYFSYVRGKSAEPSEAFSKIQEAFSLQPESFSPDRPDALNARLQRPDSAFSLHMQTPVRELEDWFSQREEYGRKRFHSDSQERLDAEAREIYPKDFVLSPSATDAFFGCPYSYFYQYSMKLKQWQEADWKPVNLGNVIHDALKDVFPVWRSGTETEKEEKLNEYFEAVRQKYFELPLRKQEEDLLGFLRKKTRDALDLCSGEVGTVFSPAEYEKSIRIPSVPLTDADGDSDGTVTVSGRFDRLDVHEENGKKYYRIVDYKTGNKKYDPEDLEKGLNLQMLLYLNAKTKEDKTEPGAVQYLSMDVNLCKKDRNETKKTSMKRSGVLLDGLEEPGNKTKYVMANDVKEFEAIFQQAIGKVREMGERLHEGDIRRLPSDSKNPRCNYCELKRVCPRAKEASEGGDEE